MNENKFKFGDLVEDATTGFRGHVIGNANYSFCQPQFYVRSFLPDQSGIYKLEWFDGDRLSLAEL
jgi:hypothetical protein